MSRRLLYAVAWHDSEAALGWEEEDGEGPPLVWSFGIVTHRPSRREPWWTLWADWGQSSDGEGNRRIKVPAGMVVCALRLGWISGETLWQEAG